MRLAEFTKGVSKRCDQWLDPPKGEYTGRDHCELSAGHQGSHTTTEDRAGRATWGHDCGKPGCLGPGHKCVDDSPI